MKLKNGGVYRVLFEVTFPDGFKARGSVQDWSYWDMSPQLFLMDQLRNCGNVECDVAFTWGPAMRAQVIECTEVQPPPT